MSDRRESGLKDRTRLHDALERLREVVDPVDRSERVPVTSAVGRVLAEDVTARRPVPHYDRAAMDGFAVRAEDTFGASDRSPAVLRTGDTVGPESGVRVHTGSELPDGADAVVRVEDTEVHGDALEVTTPVAEGENVGPAGEDVPADATVFEAGRRLCVSDLGLCKSVERTRVEVVARPTVGVVPTGEELVGSDPQPGEVVETNGLTVASFVDRWGGKPTYRNPVTDDRHALRSALQRDLTKDLVVTTGGTSVGERDLLPEVLADIGEVTVHGVALKPGYPVGFGVVRETPVLLLPGYPVSCLVTAMAFARPAVKRAGRFPLESHPSVEARLTGKLASEVGVRTFARVSLDRSDDTENGAVTAEPVRTGGASVMSSVAAADGWVVVPESREGVPAGETVTVQDWEYHP
ncbi:molybdopterin molybdenumtransferase MoeA [Halobacteriales archaeon QH_10_67_22]|nr:MAG: molybdopterin molybdenumtransferase MoeA [Halobacteriales archaeon QH_10_67_22]